MNRYWVLIIDPRRAPTILLYSCKKKVADELKTIEKHKYDIGIEAQIEEMKVPEEQHLEECVCLC